MARLGRLGFVVAAGVLAVLPLVRDAPAQGSSETLAFLDGGTRERGSDHPAELQGRFDRAAGCGKCHGLRSSHRSALIWETWAGSLMANAGRDPLFWAALDVANQDTPELARRVAEQPGPRVEIPEGWKAGSFCMRCHTTRAWYEGRANPAYDGTGLKGDIHKEGGDFTGVTCHVCHRSYDADHDDRGFYFDSDAPILNNGLLYLTPQTDVMEGPYFEADPPRRAHRFHLTETGFDSGKVGRFFLESRFCGQCHNVTNPALFLRQGKDGELVYLEDRPTQPVRVPIERTFKEWGQSDFARNPGAAGTDYATCQQCHMPQLGSDDSPVHASNKTAIRRPTKSGPDAGLGVRAHLFRGGGVWTLQVLRRTYGRSLGGDRTEAFRVAIKDSREVLAGKQPPKVPDRFSGALDVEIELLENAEPGRPIVARVKVVNRSGHKYPTGYPEGRDSWLSVTAWDDRDGDERPGPGERVLYKSGVKEIGSPRDGEWQPDSLPGKHYWVVPGIYQAGAGCRHTDGDGEELFHFVLSDCFIEDTRIPPKGFRPDAETAPILPISRTAAGGGGYSFDYGPDRKGGPLRHWDETDIEIDADDFTGRLRVRAVVYYQTTTRAYVDFLERSNDQACDPLECGSRAYRGRKPSPCRPLERDAAAVRASYDRFQLYRELEGEDCSRGEKMLALFRWNRHGAANCKNDDEANCEAGEFEHLVVAEASRIVTIEPQAVASAEIGSRDLPQPSTYW